MSGTTLRSQCAAHSAGLREAPARAAGAVRGRALPDRGRHAAATGCLGAGRADDGSVPTPVSLGQQAVHVPGIYDLEVDTSVLSPEACAERIRRHLEAGPPASASERLAAMATA